MADLAPSDQDAARAAQITSGFFYLLGDVLNGTDSTPRFDSTTVRNDGLLGPVNSPQSVAVGTDGSVYVRGTSGGYYATGSKVQPATGNAAGLTLTPGVLMLAVAVLFVLKHK